MIPFGVEISSDALLHIDVSVTKMEVIPESSALTDRMVPD